MMVHPQGLLNLITKKMVPMGNFSHKHGPLRNLPITTINQNSKTLQDLEKEVRRHKDKIQSAALLKMIGSEVSTLLGTKESTWFVLNFLVGLAFGCWGFGIWCKGRGTT
jgi:hypothetical protein